MKKINYVARNEAGGWERSRLKLMVNTKIVHFEFIRYAYVYLYISLVAI